MEGLDLQHRLGSSRLVRLLQEWAQVDGESARQDVAERLSHWLSAFDAVKLDGALQTIASYPSQTKLRGQAVDAEQVVVLPGAGFDVDTNAVTILDCHGVEQRLVGPSLREIGAKYAGRPDGEAYVTGKIKAGGVGVWGQVNRVFGTKSVSRTGLEHIAIRKTHQAACLFDHQIWKALGQHVGAATGHVGLCGRVDLESAGAREHVVAVNGGDGGDIFVAARADQRQGRAPVV